MITMGCGDESSAADDGPELELEQCDDVAAAVIGDDLSADPGIAAQQIARARSGFPHDRAHVLANDLSGRQLELTRDEDQYIQSGSLQSSTAGDLANTTVLPYATSFPDTFGAVSVFHASTGTEIVVSFTTDVDVHAAALERLLEDRVPVRVLPTTVAGQEAQAVSDRLGSELGASSAREGLITGVGGAGHIAGGEVRVTIGIIEDTALFGTTCAPRWRPARPVLSALRSRGFPSALS